MTKYVFDIPLTPGQLQAIGHVIVQWAHLEMSIDFQINMWRFSPNVPDNLRIDNLGQSFKNRFRLFKKLGRHVMAERPAEYIKEFNQLVSRIAYSNNMRNALAHGIFALQGNETDHLVTITLCSKKSAPESIRMKTKDVEELGRDISSLNCELKFMEMRWLEQQMAPFREMLLSSAP